MGVAAAQQPCDSVEDRVDEARSALMSMDFETARAAMSAAEASFTCGDVADPDVLGAFWLVEGALLWFEGDREAATESLQAAHRVAPDVWFVDFGAELLAFYESVAEQGSGRGSVGLKGVDPAYRTWVDGRSQLLPVDAAAGLHLVQIGTVDGVRFGKVVFVVVDHRSAIEPELPALPRQAEQVVTEVPVPTESSWAIEGWLAVGAGAWWGAPHSTVVQGERLDEPAVKVLVPVEGGGAYRRARWWARGTVAISPVVGSRLLYATREGASGGAAVGRGGTLGAGASVGLFDLGGSLGATLPSRAEARAVLAVRPESVPLTFEARIGANWLTDASVEPALGLTLGFRPVLVSDGPR